MDINAATVKTLRRERGWTQQHLADACEVSLRTIQRVEKDGKIAAETLHAICAVLETTPKGLSQVPDIMVGQFEQTNPLRQKLLLLAAALSGLLVGVFTTLLLI